MTDNPIILALDLSDQADAISTAHRLARHVGMFKVGLELFVHGGPDVVREILRHGDIMLDLKLHDIPNTVAGAVNCVRRHAVTDWTAHRDYAYRIPVEGRVRYLTVHASVGQKALRQAVEAADGQFGILAITVLTSMDVATMKEVGYRTEGAVERLASLAHAAGCAGVVCAPTDVAALRKSLDTRARICHVNDANFVYVTPGVRPAGSDVNDQNRVATPGEAIRNGATHLVVGRPILHADSPAQAARNILRAVEEARA